MSCVTRLEHTVVTQPTESDFVSYIEAPKEELLSVSTTCTGCYSVFQLKELYLYESKRYCKECMLNKMLKECPVCGGKAECRKLDNPDAVGALYCIQCKSCGMQTPLLPNLDVVKNAWNIRDLRNAAEVVDEEESNQGGVTDEVQSVRRLHVRRKPT